MWQHLPCIKKETGERAGEISGKKHLWVHQQHWHKPRIARTYFILLTLYQRGPQKFGRNIFSAAAFYIDTCKKTSLGNNEAAANSSCKHQQKTQGKLKHMKGDKLGKQRQPKTQVIEKYEPL